MLGFVDGHLGSHRPTIIARTGNPRCPPFACVWRQCQLVGLVYSQLACVNPPRRQTMAVR